MDFSTVHVVAPLAMSRVCEVRASGGSDDNEQYVNYIVD